MIKFIQINNLTFVYLLKSAQELLVRNTTIQISNKRKVKTSTKVI
jgi:hypothetical protein